MFNRYLQMDINMLLSMVNMQLRNHYASPAELASGHELELALLEQRLLAAGYQYHAQQNQYRDASTL